MRPRSFKIGPLAANAANNIATSQTPTTTVTLNGTLVTAGVAILDVPRRVLVTNTGDDTGKTMTIVGTTWGDTVVTDVLAMPNATTVASVIDFKTVTSMTMSSAAANALTVGTNGVAAGPWFQPDSSLAGNIAIQITVSGTVNYTVQQTLDTPADTTTTPAVLPYQVTWVSSSDTAVVSATATKQTNYLFPPSYTRVLLNSQTNPGYVTVTYSQAAG